MNNFAQFIAKGNGYKINSETIVLEFRAEHRTTFIHYYIILYLRWCHFRENWGNHIETVRSDTLHNATRKHPVCRQTAEQRKLHSMWEKNCQISSARCLQRSGTIEFNEISYSHYNASLFSVQQRFIYSKGFLNWRQHVVAGVEG